LAYTPHAEAFRQWKNYRGGTASRIWILDLETLEVEQVPQPAGRCNDTDPMWIDGDLFFLSDRDGEFNLYRHRGGSTQRLTDHDDFPVVAASAGDGVVAYEQAGYLHLFDPPTGTTRRVPVGAAADLPQTRPRYASGPDWIRNAHLSPSGARAVFEYRGEIVTVPAKKGDPRNLTRTPGAHERSPAWSPDGSKIAYISDVEGEYRLVIAPQDARGEVRTLLLAGEGFAENLKWSPDGGWISYVDNSWSLYVVDVASGNARKVSSEPLYGPLRARSLHHAWSPDSAWLAYTRNTPTLHRQVWLYDVGGDRSHPVTDGLSDATEPVFDTSGEFLWMASSTDAGPVRNWFAMSGADMESSNALYVAVLRRGVTSPFEPESDEEVGPEAGSDAEADSTGEDEPPQVRVDHDGLAQRIVAAPVRTAEYTRLTPAPDGGLVYLRSEPGGEEATLVRFDLETREETVLLEGVDDVIATVDGQNLLVRMGQQWHIAPPSGPIDASETAVDLSSLAVRVEPRAEWEQMFHEAWRINRDWFYDPGMHGADWPAMREKYAVFLPHLATRQDLNRVIRWMCSELAVGHHFVTGGDTGENGEPVPGGLLGADLEVHDGRYRFTRVLGGLNWNPELRAPLTEPGVDVRAGEYLLAVDGRDLVAPDNPYAPFEHTAGRIVELTVGPNADGSGSRVVRVVPIEDEMWLRNRAWVEDNIRTVHEATGGRVAYVYVPNTSTLGHTYFKRYFYPQADKQGIIVDERYNRGGQVADYYIDILRRPLVAHWNTRYGRDFKTPLASIQGPKVMIIDETAGSGGDLLPWMFRKFELGPLVGRPTWGGLVGILGFPVLMDGGRVSAPNLAIWTEDGFVVENVGVPPDVEVEQWPKLVEDGRDPQLEKAIEIVLERLETNPPAEVQRPPYPVRVRR
jgi:tricorn protease